MPGMRHYLGSKCSGARDEGAWAHAGSPAYAQVGRDEDARTRHTVHETEAEGSGEYRAVCMASSRLIGSVVDLRIRNADMGVARGGLRHAW